MHTVLEEHFSFSDFCNGSKASIHFQGVIAKSFDLYFRVDNNCTQKIAIENLFLKNILLIYSFTI